MKSLEILNQLQEKYHNYVIELYYSTNMSKDKRSKLYDMYEKDFNEIRQDLEVLEIIRNKRVDLSYLIFYLKHSNNDKIALSRYNGQDRFKLSMEELLKLKQWLEE